MTRTEPAIRDIYDIGVAIRAGGLNVNDNAFIDLIRKKLAVPGADAIDMSEDRIKLFNSQLETDLKPVLRSDDYAGFSVERTIAIIIDVMKRLRFTPETGHYGPPPA